MIRSDSLGKTLGETFRARQAPLSPRNKNRWSRINRNFKKIQKLLALSMTLNNYNYDPKAEEQNTVIND